MLEGVAVPPPPETLEPYTRQCWLADFPVPFCLYVSLSHTHTLSLTLTLSLCLAVSRSLARSLSRSPSFSLCSPSSNTSTELTGARCEERESFIERMTSDRKLGAS